MVTAETRIHALKTHHEYITDILEGRKTFEVRRTDDRTFELGDFLDLHETHEGRYTGRRFLVRVSYILTPASGLLPPGLVVMGIQTISPQQRESIRVECARLGVKYILPAPPSDQETQQGGQP